tara:strand:+ start:18532 stop:19596 length:1065 start_codon:yes stop_codon:yes gene_type:complete
MFVQGFGEVLTDVFTVNPAIADLPSASSILDASNYTFQAVTFGKEADGFTRHSHAVSSIQRMDGDTASSISGYDNGVLLIINRDLSDISSTSSYVVSAQYETPAFRKAVTTSSYYNSVPNDPFPSDTRLERGSTLSTNLSSFSAVEGPRTGVDVSSFPNLGHYPNAILNPQLSSIWNKIGGFAPSGGASAFFYNRDETIVFETTLSGAFNTSGLMDKNGYLTVSPDAASAGVNYTRGAIVTSSVDTLVTSGQLILRASVSGGDAISLVSFGSIKHVGVYCLDLQQMLSTGLMPPYDWDALNNNRKYKLVAKSTILDNPLFHRDIALPGRPNPESGLAYWLASNSVLISLNFDFK